MWDSEEKFIDDFLDVFNFINKSVHIIREFRTSYGLPDILVIEYDKNILIKRINKLKSSNPQPFDINCAYTMAYLSKRRWIKLDSLKINFNTNGSMGTIIKCLINRGLITTDGDKIKSLPKSQIFAIKNITAIEAKLEKWKRAIFQAQRYLWFTNNSNILIPPVNRIQLNNIINNCEKYQVGLITFNEAKTIKTIIKLKKTHPYNTYLSWLLNEFLLQEVENEQQGIQS